MTLLMVQRLMAETVPRLDLPCGTWDSSVALPQLTAMNHTFTLARGFKNQNKVVVPWTGSRECRPPEDLEGAQCRVDFDGAVTFEYVRTREAGFPGANPPSGNDQPGQGVGTRKACVVPKVKGMAQKAAVKKLKRAGCKVKVKRVRHAKVTRGRVIKASAKPGRRLRAGTVVTLSVSKGPVR
jgi:hypothetical protein